LLHQNQISKRLIAATLIMSNKLIDKERLKQLWEVIKMLDIIEIAREKGIEEGKILGVQEGLQKGKSLGIQEGKSIGIQEGKSIGIQEGKSIGIQEGKSIGIQEGKSIGIQEGKSIGIQEGKSIAIQEMLLDALIEKFGVVPLRVTDRVYSIFNMAVLKSLFRQVAKCQELKQFEAALGLACPADEMPAGHA
jgi:predicted transposase YdaD